LGSLVGVASAEGPQARAAAQRGGGLELSGRYYRLPKRVEGDRCLTKFGWVLLRPARVLVGERGATGVAYSSQVASREARMGAGKGLALRRLYFGGGRRHYGGT